MQAGRSSAPTLFIEPFVVPAPSALVLQIDALKGQLARHQAEQQCLQNTVNHRNAECARLQQQRSALPTAKQLQAMQHEKDDLEDLNARQAEKIRSLLEEKEQLESDVDFQNTTASELEEECNVLWAKIDSMQQQHQQAQQAKETAHAFLQQEANTLAGEVQAAQQQRDAALQGFADIQAEFHKVSRALSREMKQYRAARDTARDQVAQLQRQLEQQPGQQALAHTQQQLQTLTEAHQQLQHECDMQAAELQEHKKVLLDALVDAKNVETRDKDSRAKLAEAHQAAEDAKAGGYLPLTSHEAQMQAADRRAASLQQRLAALRAEQSLVQAQQKTAHAADTDKLQQAVDSLSRKLWAAQQHVEALSEDQATTQNEGYALLIARDKSQAQQEAAELRAYYLQHQLAELADAHTAALAEQTAAHHTEMCCLQQAADDRAAQLQATQQQSDSVRHQFFQLQARHRAAHETLKTQRAAATSLQALADSNAAHVLKLQQLAKSREEALTAAAKAHADELSNRDAALAHAASVNAQLQASVVTAAEDKAAAQTELVTARHEMAAHLVSAEQGTRAGTAVQADLNKPRKAAGSRQVSFVHATSGRAAAFNSLQQAKKGEPALQAGSEQYSEGMAALQDKLNQAIKEKAALQTNLDHTSKHNAELQAKLQQAAKDNQDAQIIFKRLEQRNAAMQALTTCSTGTMPPHPRLSQSVKQHSAVGTSQLQQQPINTAAAIECDTSRVADTSVYEQHGTQGEAVTGSQPDQASIRLAPPAASYPTPAKTMQGELVPMES